MTADETERLINRGSEIAGGAVGGAVGFLAGGPIGASAGAALGVSCSHALKDIAGRFLSNREEIRIGGAAAFALNTIAIRIEKGDIPRSDGFFKESLGDRSESEELFEGVLLKAKNAHEERKLEHIGKLYANIVFDESCTRAEANQLVSLAENLSYSQFCLLALAQNINSYEVRSNKVEQGTPVTYEYLSLIQQAMQLFRLSMLKDNKHFLLSSLDIVPSQLKMTWEGIRFYEKLSLSDIPKSEITRIAENF